MVTKTRLQRMMMYDRLGELVIEEEKKPNLSTAEIKIIELQKKVIKTRLSSGAMLGNSADVVLTGFETILFKDLYDKI